MKLSALRYRIIISQGGHHSAAATALTVPTQHINACALSTNTHDTSDQVSGYVAPLIYVITANYIFQ